MLFRSQREEFYHCDAYRKASTPSLICRKHQEKPLQLSDAMRRDDRLTVLAISYASLAQVLEGTSASIGKKPMQHTPAGHRRNSELETSGPHPRLDCVWNFHTLGSHFINSLTPPAAYHGQFENIYREEAESSFTRRRHSWVRALNVKHWALALGVRIKAERPILGSDQLRRMVGDRRRIRSELMSLAVGIFLFSSSHHTVWLSLIFPTLARMRCRE